MKWEYRVVNAGEMKAGKNFITEEDMLNRMGSDGWELLSPPDSLSNYYFKRPVGQVAPAPAPTRQTPPPTRQR